MVKKGLLFLKKTLLATTFLILLHTLAQCQKYRCPNNETTVQDSANTETSLNDLDIRVLNGSKDAYSECYERSWGRGQWPPLSEREFILYCYIFAVRDSNIYAAQECSTLILKQMHDGVIPIDTSLLRFIEHYAKKIESNQSIDSSNIRKFIAASNLAEIYSGELYEGGRDTIQYYRYMEAAKKYATCQERQK